MDKVVESGPVDAELRLRERELELRSRELEIRLRAVELPVQLANLGLRGTLTGGIAGAVMVIILAVISALSEKVNITGFHLAIMVGLVCVSAIMFGAFVFQRSAQISALWKDAGLTVGTDKDVRAKE